MNEPRVQFLLDNIDNIDACAFGGDLLFDKNNRKTLADAIKKWQDELKNKEQMEIEVRNNTKSQIVAYAMYYIETINKANSTSKGVYYDQSVYDWYQTALSIAESYTEDELNYIEYHDDLDSHELYKRVEEKLNLL